MSSKKPLALVILDGWGYREDPKHNAISAAHTPNWDKWWASYPHRLLDASGQTVGLPPQQMGNSEVGHMHIGAGRVIPQDFTRINQTIESQNFASLHVIQSLLSDAEKENHTIHVMGLLSPGGVHSHENHLFEFLKASNHFNNPEIRLHLFLDGRDCPPQSSTKSFERLQHILDNHPNILLCSISGRYYAMDRDQRWERVEPVYQLITEGRSIYHFNHALDALAYFYEQEIYDEFIPPTQIGECHPIRPNDSIFFFNFRADRARQLTHAILDKQFTGFSRSAPIPLRHFVSMTRYSADLDTEAVFPPPALSNTLGEILAKNNLSQLRAAETEKYAHVTFFLNGGAEHSFAKEERLLINSPKVATYDLKPQMSAPELTDQLIQAIENDPFDVIICNYANADMVGHTGNFEATKQAIACLDTCLGRLYEAIQKQSGMMLITADHGNAELMFDKNSGQAQTAHTSLPVPLLFLGTNWQFENITGSLVDIAPTILTLLNLDIPQEMTGQPLLVKAHESLV